jgi:hypothetical protein
MIWEIHPNQLHPIIKSHLEIPTLINTLRLDFAIEELLALLFPLFLLSATIAEIFEARKM